MIFFLIAKQPFIVGNFMVLQNEEFSVCDKHKQTNTYVIRPMRDPRVTIESTAEELDSRFYISPADERTAARTDIYPLLGYPSEKPPKSY